MVNGDYDKARVPAHPSVRRRATTVPPGRWTPGRGRSALARQAEHVDRPGAGPDGAQAVADRLRRDALGLARRGLEVVAQRQPRGQRRGVRAARAVRRAVGVARARRARPRRSPSKTTSIACSRCPPVTTTARGPSAWTARASSSPLERRRRRRARAPRGGSGVDDRGARQTTSSTSAAWASSSSSRAPDSATTTGSTTTACPGASRSKASPMASRAGHASEHADLDRVDADVLDDRALPGRRSSRATPPRPPSPPTVFCAVIAVIAVVPWTPAAREGLQVGLDPGATAGIRAGDRQADGYAAGVGHGGEG